MNSISNFFKKKEYNYFEGTELKTKELGIVQRFCRYFFGYAPETHLLNVVKQEYELKHIKFKKEASDNPTDQKILGLIFKANEIYGVNKGEPAFINLEESKNNDDLDVQVGYVVKKDRDSKFLLEKIEVKVSTKSKIPGIKVSSSRAIIQISPTEREEIKVLVNRSQLSFFKNKGMSQSVNATKKFIEEIQRQSGLNGPIEYEAIPRPLKGK